MSVTPDSLVANSKTEHSIQTAFFCWINLLKQEDLKWVHAIPNGGERNKITAGKMKAEGARSGVWDVFMPVPRGQYHGMYIEFKTPEHRNHRNGGLKPNQMEFGQYAHGFGYRMYVAYTWREAAMALLLYLGDDSGLAADKIENPEAYARASR